ncbi:MAG: LysM peptidoglycan-binding domain-containing protein [Methylococcales bacterium]|nr:LysM peptidoglycan-binding domain-containing protein [Methylococcales bacterium]
MEQLQKANMVATYHDGSIEFFEVQFNPTEFSLDKGVQIAEIAIPGLDSPLLQFVRGQNEKMTVDLFFDTTESGMGPGATSVTTLTDRVYELVKIEPARHAPPICSFLWNSKFPGADLSPQAGNQRRMEFQCVVESIKQKFTLFSPEGVPLRATLSLTLREYKTLDEQLRQLNLSSPDRSHSHVMQQGETISALAGRYYRKPEEWRPIAEANNIEDPRRLTSGTFLIIPPID